MIFKVLLLTLIKITIALAHYDEAYFHDEDDNFIAYPNWMKNIRDDVMLSELALPGTHDSATFTSSNDFVKCQAVNFIHQLLYGIRVFDIRIRHIENTFALHHGAYFLDLLFGDFLISVTNFLNQYPSEVVLFRLKKEYDPENNTRSFLETLESYLNRFKNHYLRVVSNINLGLARGKFIILVDVASFHGYGLPYADFKTQDEWNIGSIWGLHRKWEYVHKHLEKAAYFEANKSKFYVNYLSGSNGGFPYFVASGHSFPGTSDARLWTGHLARQGSSDKFPSFPRLNCFLWLCSIYFEGTNILASNQLWFMRMFTIPKRTVGIIMADFPGTKLIYEIINNNKYL